jgi:RNA polymerase sigma-70 factor, ECF subfamily
MARTGTPGDFDPAIRRMISAKASRLVGQYGLRAQDRPDVEQDLAARIAARLDDHDPTRGPLVAFVAMVIEQAAANLLRERRAGKRTPPRRPGPPAPPEEVPDIRVEDDRRRQDLAQDVAAVLARLPADLRAFAAALTEATVSEVSRRSGVPRTTLYGPLAELRVAFERAGLRGYG